MNTTAGNLSFNFAARLRLPRPRKGLPRARHNHAGIGSNCDKAGANIARANRHIGRLLRRLSFSLVALNLVWAFPKLTVADEPTAMILVYDYARVSPAILAAAEREAGRILDAAGVRITWVECPLWATTARAAGPCWRRLKSTGLMLRVLPPPAQHSLKADVFGFAISSNIASVYYDYAVRLAVEEANVEFDARIILGCVIAHELGHLLIGPNSHSSAGIMRSPWGQKQVQQALAGALLFTPEQARVMQAQVRVRTRPQTNSRFRASRKTLSPSPETGLPKNKKLPQAAPPG